MAFRHYVENFDGWHCNNSALDDQWNDHDLTQYGIPPSAVVEIAVGNHANTAEYYAGVRKTGSSLDRRILIAEAEGAGEHLYTVLVQADASGHIEYYSDFYDVSDFPAYAAPNFWVVGWWLGCEYIEKIESFTPNSPSGWESYALDQYGVSGSQVADIIMTNDAESSGLEMGIRTSGSSLERKFRIKEAEGGGKVPLSISVTASGDTAAIDIYAENTSECLFYLLGYFTTPPGDYIEQTILFQNPTIDEEWQSLNVGSSGIPNNAVAQCVVGNIIDADENKLGIRQTSSTLERVLDIDESETDGTTPGKNWGSMYVSVDSSGCVEYMSEDVSDDPDFMIVGYWTNFTESDTPFLKTYSINCFIYGKNPYIHYIETMSSTTDFFNINTADVWEEYDLTTLDIPIPASTESEPIVAEICIRNHDASVSYKAGARSTSSSADRYVDMHDAEGGGADWISLLTPVDESGKISLYAGHVSYIDFFVLGFWRGSTYIDSYDTFQIGTSGEWINYNLGSDCSNKIAEIAITNIDSVHQSGGVRSVGSSIHRCHQLTKGETGSDHVTTSVNTSGINGTIQTYSSHSGNIIFTLMGYWDTPPGVYHETFSDVSALTENATWQPIDIGVTQNSVAEIVIENRYNNAEEWMGVREINSDHDRRLQMRETDLVSSDLAGDMCRLFTNVSSGTHVELYHYSRTYDHAFRLVGYWNNFNLIPVSENNTTSLYTKGCVLYNVLNEDAYPSGLTMYINGALYSTSSDLFIQGYDNHQCSGDLFIDGIFRYATNAEDCPAYPSGLQCYTAGSGIIPESGQCNLVICGTEHYEASGDFFTEGHASYVASGNLFIKGPEPSTSSVNLIIYNLIDVGPGLIREANAVFYLRYYHDGLGAAGGIQEFVNDQEWYIPDSLFQHSPFIGIPGKTVEYAVSTQIVEPFVPTFGDGTYPYFNDLGGSNYREAIDNDYRTPGGGWQSTKLGYYESTKYKQNITSPVEDYQYAGSGSFTTVFWMSGANTSGNIAEVGWFYKSQPEATDVATTKHTLGIRIEGESGITVITNVSDLSYTQESGGGLWWGGTTHYGTPTGTSYTWRSTEEYHTWTEEWPTIYTEHDQIAFIALHAEFIASGVDGTHPNHMKVYFSIDGQPWSYIGSGLTGPPASSFYSYTDPVNRYPDNCVGVRQQGINITGGIVPPEIGGTKQGSIILSENVLWTNADRFTTDELRDLHKVVDQYHSPLNEYRPTIVPPSTYIKRTFSDFIYDPTIIDIGYNPSEICSGILVTIEVGLGAYGEDASAYLIEENVPSGAYVRNISRSTGTSIYTSQGSRPAAGQAAFNDPQSGIISPYDANIGNIYGAQIRFVNHDNNPELNKRRSPQPIKTFTYELYPQHYSDMPYTDTFEFSGSGIFFGGSTGSDVFIVDTTNDTQLNTSGLTGGVVQQGCPLYIAGPLTSSDIVNLYLRTQETFTSAYIGTAANTPKAIDFIFAADGAAAIESMAGIEYGPPLCIKGPLSYDDTCTLVIFGPAANNIDFFIIGYEHIDTSGDYPSGILLRIGDGHEPFYASGTLFIDGPVPCSGDISMHTRAGAFEPPIDLFICGHTPYFDSTSGYIKGPEFICSSGSFSYPYDIEDFTYPYGDSSPTLFMHGHTDTSGTCPLYIGPPKAHSNWTLYLKTEDNDESNTINLFINGFIPASGSSGVNQTFNTAQLYLEAANADYPYTAGGTKEWTLFLKTPEGNLTNNEAWSLFLKADRTIPVICNLYTRGHASGQPPNGIEITGSMGLVCSVNPTDPRRIGFIPYDSDNDPWTLFLKCVPGYFNTATLYMSGAAPTLFSASGNLFVKGLFEQEISTLSLYLMGVSGMFNNGPSGLHLFLDANTLVYNTSMNLYSHGY